ncbi:uncharacterized protein LOC122015689 [Zingiber officinale]|uniref:uncharacterized protein LOC122015689 n=1 Tax=Zingiber officinale TaxID=94328 RepID=UPI001C4B95CB|nr:uncharacterized protein LOC122015689 [Zingiber officinale]
MPTHRDTFCRIRPYPRGLRRALRGFALPVIPGPALPFPPSAFSSTNLLLPFHFFRAIALSVGRWGSFSASSPPSSSVLSSYSSRVLVSYTADDSSLFASYSNLALDLIRGKSRLMIMDSSLEGQYAHEEDPTKLMELVSKCLPFKARDVHSNL